MASFIITAAVSRWRRFKQLLWFGIEAHGGDIMRLFALRMAASAALLFVGEPISAQQDSYRICANESGDVAIAACTRGIASGNYRGHDLAVLHTNRGFEYRAKGDFNRAMEDYNEAIRIDPKHAAAYNNRCYARVAANRQLQQALADCDTALRLEPATAKRLDSRGLVYLRLGRLDDAIADYDAALKLNPKLATSLYGRGLAKLGKGDVPGGNVDTAAARAVQSDIAEEFTKYGFKL